MDIMTASGKEAAQIGASTGQNGYIGFASANSGLRSVTTPIVAAPQYVPQIAPQVISQGTHDAQWFHNKFAD